MIAGLTLLLLVGLAAVYCVRPMWGLYSLVFVLPFEWIGSWPLNPATGHPVVSLAEVVAAAWLMGLAYGALRGHVRLVRPVWPWLWLTGFIVAAAVSAALVGHLSLFESFVIVVLLYAATTAIAISLRQANLKAVVGSLMASAGLVSLFGLYQFVMGTFRILKWSFLRAPYIRDLFGFPRIHSVTSEPLYFANYLLIPLLIGIALLLVTPRELKRWQKLAVGLVALDFFLTMSRGAIIGLIPAVVLVVWGARRLKGARISWRPVAIGAGSILVVGLLAVGTASLVSTGNALTGIGNFAKELTVDLTKTGSFTQRESSSSLGLQIAKSHPVFGVGLAGITPYIRGYGTPRRPDDVIALNNQAVELLAETGIVGTVVFYVFLLGLFWVGWRVYGRRKGAEGQALLLGSMGALLAMTIQAQSFTGFFLMPFWAIYGLVLGLAA